MDLPTEIQVEWFDENNQRRSGPQPIHLVGPSIRLLENFKGFQGAQELLAEVIKGFQFHDPELADEGEGGTYFLKNKRGKKIAVFKPCDEQPHCANNPKSKDSDILLPLAFQGIKMDEGPKNEVAAFLLDRQLLADVPLTVLAECTHHVFSKKRSATSGDSPKQKELAHTDGKIYQTKVGSLQKYVEHDAQSWDMGSSRYLAREVHRIGILDIRLLNLDRHGGNILVVRNPGRSIPKRSSNPRDDLDLSDEEDEDERRSGSSDYHLVPIDHAFSLPDCVNGTDLWFEWLSWPQSNQPFSDDLLHFIEDIDLEDDARLLHSAGIRKECIQTMLVTTLLLKNSALELKMTLSQIARLICREGPNKPSVLEKLNKIIQEELLRLSRDTPNVPEGSRVEEPTKIIEQELKEFVSVASQIIATHLPTLVNLPIPKPVFKVRRSSTISNELYLHKLVEDQLKITDE